MPEMIPVASSNVASVGYDEAARELHVEFRSGSTYVYSDVGRETYDDLLAAASPGSYIARWLKGAHQYRSVRRLRL